MDLINYAHTHNIRRATAYLAQHMLFIMGDVSYVASLFYSTELRSYFKTDNFSLFRYAAILKRTLAHTTHTTELQAS